MTVQDMYENVLGAHWQKLHQIKELIETSSGSYLRMKSIAGRRDELSKIENQKLVLEQLSEDILLIPDWYVKRLKEIDYDFSSI